MTLRVYLPSTLDEVAEPQALAPRTGYAVSDELRRELPDEDEEGLEYEAYRDAVRASLKLLAARPAAPRRRVVIAADVEPGSVAPIPEAGEHQPASAIAILVPVEWRAVVSFHVDDPGQSADVAAAIGGSQPAAIALEGEELAWYDVTERHTLA